MKRYTFVIICLLSVCISQSCSKDNDLSKSVFIYDDENSGLPEYSEWGYNTFGAYYDRNVFVSNDYALPVKIIVTDNSTTMRLQGQLNSSDYYYGNNEMTLTFKLNAYNPEVYTDLVVLNDSTINLNNENVEVFITNDTSTFEAEIITGELNFNRIQKLFVDEEQIEIIASGYFSFKALMGDEPITISNGRFDLGISNDNFYKY